jgi:TldD protein
MRAMPELDQGFLALPADAMADAAIDRARGLGASYADFRLERHKGQYLRTRDRNLEAAANTDSLGYGVRVIVDGAWGFAASFEVGTDAAARTAARAVEVARTLASLNSEPVELADEPAHSGTHISSYEINPFDVSDDDKVGFLLGGTGRLLDSGKVDVATGALYSILENKFFVSMAGARQVQQRVRMQGNFTATKVDRSTGAFEDMRTNAQPVGRGWEYFTKLYDFDGEIGALPDLLEEKMGAPSVEPGPTDLVIDPTNLWLTIHESIGHSTELDRVLGYEANYAGTSFATLDKLNTLQFGSPVMNVTGDRMVENGLSTVGWDDEGVAAQQWDIIRDGVLVGYQLNRQMALKLGFGRSNGCAFADAPSHVPLQRMPNVSLQASPDPTTLQDLIGGVEDGIYIIGDKSWSIDMQRYNFQFTGQQFWRIRGGKLAGQLRDVAYQSKTTDFWNSMEAVGGASTYLLGGAFNCGKGQPGQVAPVTHGCPPALFRGVNVLNTREEGAR